MSSWLGVATATTRSPPVQLDPVLALERNCSGEEKGPAAASLQRPDESTDANRGVRRAETSKRNIVDHKSLEFCGRMWMIYGPSAPEIICESARNWNEARGAGGERCRKVTALMEVVSNPAGFTNSYKIGKLESHPRPRCANLTCPRNGYRNCPLRHTVLAESLGFGVSPPLVFLLGLSFIDPPVASHVSAETPAT
ncbi:hypothetical protein GEV33_001099 [Tenebrio molitor]|uniref:Uncharacterized protein n=1 Tax=Tenebrio molitor TaxID=7067 RepID=A0A8J6LKA0_TENMO|nr:hypothetical protein GEV33_001099 [Tenebrio molitor]